MTRLKRWERGNLLKRILRHLQFTDNMLLSSSNSCLQLTFTLSHSLLFSHSISLSQGLEVWAYVSFCTSLHSLKGIPPRQLTLQSWTSAILSLTSTYSYSPLDCAEVSSFLLVTLDNIQEGLSSFAGSPRNLYNSFAPETSEWRPIPTHTSSFLFSPLGMNCQPSSLFILLYFVRRNKDPSLPHIFKKQGKLWGASFESVLPYWFRTVECSLILKCLSPNTYPYIFSFSTPSLK